MSEGEFVNKPYAKRIDEEIKRIDEEIKLGSYRCARAYMIAAEKVDIDYTKRRELHIPYPTKAVQYARLVSKELIEPVTKTDRKEQEHAEIILKELRNRKLDGNKRAREYLIDYITSIENSGQRVADKVVNTRERLSELEEERKTWFGIGMQVADILGFRVVSGAAGYSMLEGPLGEAEFEAGGVHFRGKDVAWAGFATFFGVSSAASYLWKSRKKRGVLKGLKSELDKLYREAISETLEDLRRYYPETIVPLGDEEVLAERDATQRLMRKYGHKKSR